MDYVIEVDNKDAGIFKWTLPAVAAEVLVALPDDETRALVLKRLQAIVTAHLGLVGASLLIEDVFQALDLIQHNEINLGGTLRMMF
jgi:hypothetical protein